MPRRPWRSLNSFSASPIRVPLDQSGAARGGALDRALRVAGGQRAGQAGQPRGEHERLGVRAAAGGAGQELQVGARVGLHRARDVAQHHEPPADDAPAPAREADRVAAGAQAARAASGACRCAGRGAPARSGACAAAASRARGATSAGRAARARAARARRSACRPAAPRRSPSPAGRSTSGSSSSSPSPGGDDAALARRPSGEPSPPARSRARRRPLVGGRASALVGLARRRRRRPSRRPRRRPATCARSETNTERAVQYSRRRLIGPHERERPREAGRALGGHRHARLVQALAQRAGERRQVELDRLDAEAGSVTAAHELLEAGRADHLLVLVVLEHRARACGPPPRRRACSIPSRLSAASQSIASAIPGGFCTSLSRMRETASATCTASVSRRALARGGARSRPRAPASGSRSSGRGSGA